ncbi:class II aldolase/adducin family protein [Sphingobium sp. BS19]|uniref:class II aldolase/adducin family protein n=1 Tax=Sphingobium sp. BS19 TaxID=3018973 RepID=UPI0022EFAB72|nr:class II aldolase/adducin family protein [Sphingobium sp. BS19]GLI98614.1 class II aldolase [Sphingobium sp. BS19]
MATAIEASRRSMSDAEWAARQQLAACYRIFARQGWDELIYNHITLRVPGEDNAFLINPYGLHYREICASNLVKIDIDGTVLDGSPYPVNKAGFTQHSVFHRHLPDAHCIIHTHTTAGMAVSATQEGLMPTNFYAAAFHGQIAYHAFEGITIRPEEGVRLIESLGNKRTMMLRNHGTLVMAETLPAAFFRHWALQRACEIQVATGAAGTPALIPDAVIAVHQRDMAGVQLPGGQGAADFAAMVRMLERDETDWKE